MLDKVWIFLSCHGVNVKCLRTVRPGVTCLPTLVAHYGIWSSLTSHINIHHIRVSCRSWCDFEQWSHSCCLGWHRVHGLGNPATGLQLVPPLVMVVVWVDHKVDWKAELAIQFLLQRIAASYQSLGTSSEGQPYVRQAMYSDFQKWPNVLHLLIVAWITLDWQQI